MKTPFKKLAAVVGVSAALGMGVAGQARADALAEAFIGISAFTLTNGTSALTLADFSQLTFTDTLTNNAQLNGTFDSKGAVANTFVPFTDPLQACVGTCPGQNVYTASGIPLTAVFGRSDSILANAPIAGTGLPVGVTANTIGQTSVLGGSSGSGGSQIQLTASFTFVLAHDVGQLGITFNAADFIRTWTNSLSAPGTSAGASLNWSMVLKDGNTTLLQWEPNGSTSTGTQTGLNVSAEACDLNLNSSATFNDPQGRTECSGSFAAVSTFMLDAGHSYSLTISQNVNSQATSVQSVPEPGSLALLGLGLAGLGFSVFRRRKVS